MAKDPSKTEDPTAKRIQKSREDGNVLVSQDVTSVVVMIGGAAIVAYMAHTLSTGYYDVLRSVVDEIRANRDWDAITVKRGTVHAAKFMARIMFPLWIGVVLLSYASIKAQVGKYFSLKPLQWKFDKLNPASGIQQVLPNMKNTVKLGLVLMKVAIIAFFVYTMIRENVAEMLALPTVPLLDALQWIAVKIGLLVMKIFGFFVIVAILDYLYKHYDYYENLKMSKQEVKDEQKETEGDPKVKAKIKQKMMQMTLMRMITEVPKADVIVTNPTHVAIALQYAPGSFAPRVLAKGLRKRAERIKEIARNHDIPIIEAPPLARSLYRHTKLGGFIPEHLFAAVAAILARVHARRRRREAVRTNLQHA